MEWAKHRAAIADWFCPVGGGFCVSKYRETLTVQGLSSIEITHGFSCIFVSLRSSNSLAPPCLSQRDCIFPGLSLVLDPSPLINFW